MDIERERGITIKAQTAALRYKARDGQVYNLNLIDTPGHVDFSYEVRARCPPAKARCWWWTPRKGVEAQTVANCCTALDLGVEVVPVLNKIDLPAAEPERVRRNRRHHRHRSHRRRARLGQERHRHRRHPGNRGAENPGAGRQSDGPLKALIVDSWFGQLRRRGDAGARGGWRAAPGTRFCSCPPRLSICASKWACSPEIRIAHRAARR